MSRIVFEYPHCEVTPVVAPPSVSFRARSIGEIVREAREYGVLPELSSSPCANDDDTPDVVDVHANPRIDPLELVQRGIGDLNVAVIKSSQLVSEPAAPTAPAEGAAPIGSSTSAD